MMAAAAASEEEDERKEREPCGESGRGKAEAGKLAAAEGRVTVWAGVMVSLGGIAWGLDLGSISGAYSEVEAAFSLSPTDKFWFFTLMSLGELCGASVSGLAADGLGRRAAVALADGLFAASAVVLAGARSKSVLFMGRFGSGLAIGSSFVAQIAWASEVAPARTRGTVTATYELAISLGFVLSFAVFAMRPGAWRLLVCLPGLPAILQLVAVAVAAPESPRWLAATRGQARADRELARIYRVYGGRAQSAPRAVVEEPADDGTSCLDAWRAWWQPWVCVVLVAWLTFFTGGFNLRIFIVPVLALAGHSTRTAAILTLVLGLVKLLSTAAAVLAVDVVGRLPLLSCCLRATLLCAATIALIFASRTATELVFPLACLYTAAFQLGFGTCNFVLVGELFPPSIKGRLVTTVKFPAAAFQAASQALFALAIDTPAHLAAIFLAHAAAAALGLALVAALFVESHDRSPFEVRDLLAAKFATYYTRLSQTDDDHRRPPRLEPPRAADRAPRLHLASFRASPPDDDDDDDDDTRRRPQRSTRGPPGFRLDDDCRALV